MDYIIREIHKTEYPQLKDFLYLAIHVQEGFPSPPRSILTEPELLVYTKDFGRPHDHAFVADAEGRLLGIIWARFMRDYGYIDDDTPSLAISVLESHRGLGIGSQLMKTMLGHLKSKGYPRVSLSVQKTNRAAKWYLDLGFRIWRENEEDYILYFSF